MGRYIIDNPEPPGAMEQFRGNINRLGQTMLQLKMAEIERQRKREDEIALIKAKTEAEMASPLGQLDIASKLAVLNKNRYDLGLEPVGEDTAAGTIKSPSLGNIQSGRLSTSDMPLPTAQQNAGLSTQQIKPSFKIKNLDKFGRPTGYELDEPSESQQKRNIESTELAGQTKNIMELFNTAMQEARGLSENVGKEGIGGRMANIGVILKGKAGYAPTVNVFQDRVKAFATVTAKQAGEQRPTDADIERFIGAMMNFKNNDKENAVQMAQQLKDLEARGLSVEWANPLIKQFQDTTGVSVGMGPGIENNQQEKTEEKTLDKTFSPIPAVPQGQSPVFGQKNQQSFSLRNVPFLPKIESTEQKIGQRPSAIQELIKDPTTLERFKKHPLGTSLRTLAGAGELAEGAIADVGLAAQRGSAEGLGRQLADTFSGRRPAQLGDIVRTTGFGGELNELIARTTGLLASFKVLDVPTKGKLVNSANKAEKFLKSKTPVFMNKNYMLKRAEMASDGLDELYEGLSKEYDSVYDKIGKIQLKRPQQDALEEILSELPESVVNKILKSKLVSKTKSGEIIPDINNLKAIKGEIKKSVPDKVWMGKAIGDQNTATIEQAYGKISGLMAEGNPDLVALNKKYGEFRNMQKEINGVIFDQYGNIKTKALEQLFSKTGERGKQVFFEKFAQQWPKAAQIIKDTQKYNKRQGAKKLALQGAGIVAATGVGTAIARPLFRHMGGD